METMFWQDSTKVLPKLFYGHNDELSREFVRKVPLYDTKTLFWNAETCIYGSGTCFRGLQPYVRETRRVLNAKRSLQFPLSCKDYGLCSPEKANQLALKNV